MNIERTQHANTRMQQRGIKPEIIDFIFNEADQVKRCRGGATSLFVSKKKLASAEIKKGYPAHLLERVNGVVLVEVANNLVTAFHKKRRMRLN